MSSPKLVVPPHLHERQTRASNPALSIWVSANAGAGKTHVLTQRVIRLLLQGVAPAKILCLTFTKAAAAQMATRVFDELSRWTQLDDAALRDAITATGAPSPGAQDLLLARRLFTRTVETPGGLKIQTIHAFCERLLHLFPFEANVPAHFEVADERRTQEMLSLAKQAAIADARGSADIALVADVAGASNVHPLIAQTMKPRAAARRASSDPQSNLARRLGIDDDASVKALRASMLDDGLPPTQWLAVAAVLDAGRSTDQRSAAALRKASEGLAERDLDSTKALNPYLSVFFESKGTPRNRLMTAALAAAHPDLCDRLVAERDRLSAVRTRLKTAETVERTQALVGLVDAVLDRYDAAKVAQGLLDFDDLIDRTLTLLDRSDSGWVLHKLDAGIDHVLVDEAQDTSEAQWKILERLTGDFASGEGARASNRSFFVVGDDKQSIFSFQGAAPLMFDEMRRHFQRRFEAGRKPFERVSLKTSFRSVPGVLDAVDQVFASDLHQDGLVQPGDVWPLHESIKARHPGLIEIWPAVGAATHPDPADWTIPLDTPPENDPVNVVADRVAQKIKTLTAPASDERVHDGRSDTPRRIRAGDIIVLVRTRNAFFEAVIRALKRHHVPVAGADRLDVANHIAVMDLVAAGRTALLPRDDLSLACLLKSPLFGLTDNDLIYLAPNRPGALIDALAGSATAAHAAAHTTILRWAARAPATTPFAFYVELLGRDGGRKLMESRLGPEAHDAIDEFLRLALAHEQQGAPSLGSFLSDVEALESSIKRDMEGPGDSVRVMTVHAAKGLEAKVVFLPDTCSVPAQQLEPTVFDLDRESGGAPLLAWSPRKANDPAVVETARAATRKATLREYRRLLYVALTRAEERLYIAGFYNSQKPPDDSWSAMIARAFPDTEEAEAFWGGDVIRRIVTPGTLPKSPLTIKTSIDQGLLPYLPTWLSIAMPPTRGAPVLRPSKLRAAPKTNTQERGLVFGSALHLLLQYMPTLEADRREEAARTYLQARAATIPADMHDDLIAEGQGVLTLPELAPLFAKDAKAEVAIIGRLPVQGGGMRDVRGTVDRLVVEARDIIIADFKTGTPQRPPPRAYVEQLALYSRVLAPLWPDRTIRALLVWTHGPEVVELDSSSLSQAAETALTCA